MRVELPVGWERVNRGDGLRRSSDRIMHEVRDAQQMSGRNINRHIHMPPHLYSFNVSIYILHSIF